MQSSPPTTNVIFSTYMMGGYCGQRVEMLLVKQNRVLQKITSLFD
jgi:hypothetical protein